jgi:hypothetical protein
VNSASNRSSPTPSARRTTLAQSIAALAVTLTLSGCAALLPTSEATTQTPWRSFDEAMRVYDSIEPSKTTATDLKAIGLDPFAQSNIAILDYTEVIRRFAPPGTGDLADLAPPLRKCLQSAQSCRGYEIDQKVTHQDHIGNFWLDFLNFRRTVKTTGWRFTATLVIDGDLVVHKAWSGQPSITALDDSRNPLGPAQSIGTASLPSWR